MNERKRRMIHWYDHVASAFDCHPLPLSTRLAEALVRRAAISEGEWVLDVGTGTGNVALAAARCVGARGRVIGVDLSAAMLREARRRAGDLPVEFREMDAEALQFGDATFHAALGGLLPEVAPVINEMYRVLRPGGRAAFSTYTQETFRPLADVTWSRLERRGIWRPPAPPESGTVSRESERFLQFLEKVGFREARVVPEPYSHMLLSAEDWWTYMLRSTRWGPSLDRFSAEALEDLKSEILQDVKTLRTDEGIQVDMSALIVIGIRG